MLITAKDQEDRTSRRTNRQVMVPSSGVRTFHWLPAPTSSPRPNADDGAGTPGRRIGWRASSRGVNSNARGWSQTSYCRLRMRTAGDLAAFFGDAGC